MAGRCGDGTVLLGEVHCLLRTHDNAGEFLAGPKPESLTTIAVSLPVSTVATNRAAHAEAFLRGHSNPAGEQCGRFIEQLRGEIRPEVRARIQAGLRIRGWRVKEWQPCADPADRLFIWREWIRVLVSDAAGRAFGQSGRAPRSQIYLLADWGLVARKPAVIGLGIVGLSETGGSRRIIPWTDDESPLLSRDALICLHVAFVAGRQRDGRHQFLPHHALESRAQ